MAKSKNKSTRPDDSFPTYIAEKTPDIGISPFSATLNTLNQCLRLNTHIDELPRRMAITSHSGAKYGVFKEINNDSGLRIVTMEDEKKDAFIKITFPPGTLKANNTGTQKIFAFILGLINKIGAPDPIPEDVTLDDVDVGKYTLSFPVDMLVDYGLYTRKDHAIRGFLKDMFPLKYIGVSWIFKTRSTKKNKKSRGIRQGTGFLFSDYEVDEYSVCHVRISEKIDWTPLFLQFGPRPTYWYSLSPLSTKLVGRILELAAMDSRIKEIANKGYFKISIDVAINAMCLPTMQECERKKQFIFDPIHKAITDNNEASQRSFKSKIIVETIHSKTGGEDEYIIKSGDGTRIDFIVRDGKIQGLIVFFAGKMRQWFIDKVTKQNNRVIAAKIRNRERRREKELALAMATAAAQCPDPAQNQGQEK